VKRSYQGVMNFETMAAQIKDEAEFLREQYPKLSNNFGTPYLADTLNRLYLEKVRISWPTINDWILVHQARFASLDIEDKEGTILQILSKTFCRSRKLKSAEIQKTFEESFSRISDGIGPLTGLSKSHIQAAVNSAAGQKKPLVTVFDVLAKKQIGPLREPSLDYVRLVVKELQEIAKSSLAELLQTLLVSQNCIGEIGKVFKELLKERVQLSNGLVLVSRQTSRSFTRKP
jgi:hypothetical protein